MLVLFIIFTGCLFSQGAKNETIEEDNTIIMVNTLVVTEVDTFVIEESVSEPEEKIDLSNYDFYKDYLDYIKRTNSSDDVLIVNECKKTGMISGQIGAGTLIGAAYSVALDIPISCKINITSKYTTGIAGMDGGADRFSLLGVGLGYVAKKTNYFILKLNVYPSLEFCNKEQRLNVNLGADILSKVFGPCYLSINPEFFVFFDGFLVMISLGLNLVY
jgi:hypothetical protein